MQSTHGQLHQDLRGDPSAVPAADKILRTSQLLHEKGNVGLDGLPHEPHGEKILLLRPEVDLSSLKLGFMGEFSGYDDGASSADHRVAAQSGEHQ